MNVPFHPHAGHSAGRLCVPLSLCLLLFVLGACAKDGSQGGEPVNPQEKQLAYGLSMNVPAGWTVNAGVAPEAGSKAALDARRKAGEDVLLFETGGAAGPRGLPPLVSLILTNEEGAFIPREYAAKLTPEEFETMAKNIMKGEREKARKNKAKNSLLDLRLSRDSLGGNLAVHRRLIFTGPDGKPVRQLGWDVYLPNGAGLGVICSFDPDVPGAEAEVTTMVKSLRAR